MGSFFVVVIVGGALLAITMSALDAAQPATARAGSRSAGDRVRDVAERARGTVDRAGHVAARGWSAVTHAGAAIASASVTAFRRAGSVSTGPLSPVMPTPVAAPAEMPAHPPTADDLEVDPDGEDDADLDDDPMFAGGYDADNRIGVLRWLRSAVWFTALVAVLGALAASAVLTGLLVSAVALRGVLG